METVTVSQSYLAARETCARLYVATGGNPAHRWTVTPFQGTAAISRTVTPYTNRVTFRLGMPAMPLEARLSRREADLMAAYVVHELGHALFTDFEGPGSMIVASREGIGRLLNAIEDGRIERKLATTATVPEARKLLETLTAYIVDRDTNKNGYDLTNPHSFAFTLSNVLMTEALGYTVPAFPRDWRDRLPGQWVRVLDHCVARLPALTSTADALDLARWVRDEMARAPVTLPPPPPVNGQGPQGEAEGEGEPEGAQGAGQREPEPEDEPEGEGAGQREPEPEDEPESEGPGASQAPTGEADAEGEGGAGGEQSDAGGEGVDLSDTAQQATEPDLSDIAAEVCDRMGKDPLDVAAENGKAAGFLDCAPSLPGDWPDIKRSGANKMASAIDAPAKLRRDVRAAVKAPERVGVERYQTSGRLDMRQMSQFDTSGALFKRRFEEEGREAAVSLLLDMSSSMGPGRGTPAEAAGALALHLGEALKSAGVAFEIAGFADTNESHPPQSRLYVAKAFSEGWADVSKARIALMMNRVAGGTAMLPAMHDMAGRLARKAHVTRRILLVLTDGEDGYSRAANRACIAHWRARGVEIVGIGCLCNVAGVFGPAHVNVRRLSDVSSAGLGALVQVLNPARPMRKSAA